MVKVIVGLMGGSAARGASFISGSQSLSAVLDVLKQRNITELDTARAYNNGQNEEDIGGVPTAQQDFFIATKVPGFSPGSLAYQTVIDSCNASLKALKQDKIGLYYFHGPDSETPLVDSCKAIDDLHKAGKIVKFGVSNHSLAHIEEIHTICTKNGWVKPTVYQGLYNPLARTSEGDLLPLLRRLGMAFYAYSPLAGGYFGKTTAQLQAPAETGRMGTMKQFHSMFVNPLSLKLHDKMQAACEAEGSTIKEAALRWLMHHSALGEEDGVILGASDLQQVEENVAACQKGPLPASVAKCFEDVWAEYRTSEYVLPSTFG